MGDNGPAATEFEFCLLGPLTARRNGIPFTVPPGKQRVILAMLLLNPGRVVRLDELAEALWADGPPPSGPVAVQNYVMRLRRTLGEAGRDRIITQAPGYLIRVTATELDVSRFEALLRAARAAARDCSWDQAALHSRNALALWRGEPLADVDCEPLAAREAPRLAELRLQALEIRIDADLHLGRHAEVIAELRQLAAEHPLRERLHAALMLALYCDGRQAEALAAYADARRVLVIELGTEPGGVLRELHHQILTADPALDEPVPARPAGGNALFVPRELPASVRNFTGRSDELRTLTLLLDRANEKAPGTVVISAIGGTAGVGKTALAVHWAHQVAGRFPDGQLYVNLRGYDPGQPLTAAGALAGFLRSLGMPGQDIPAGEAERAARYRTMLAGRRMLVLLDNAGSVEQVRPLLPGSPTCATLVTSRDSLAGLVARDGAVRLDLDLLPLADAVALIRDLIGERADEDPRSAAVLAAQCCRLPLALRVTAELAVTRPAAPLADLTAELRDQHSRLDLLEADGDPSTAVRAVFSWSCRHLETSAARAFRLLGLHPNGDFEAHAAAALTGTGLEQARHLLDRLSRAHLIQPARTGRYGMHDLLRAYAQGLAARQDTEQERRIAVARLLDHYLYTASVAMNALFPAERHRRPVVCAPDTPVPSVASPATARGWLDAERANLTAIAVYAAADGWPAQAIGLARVLFRYLESAGHYTEIITINTQARQAARDTGNRSAEAEALNSMTLVDLQQGRYEQASDQLVQALTLYQQVGDQAGEGRALGNLGLISYQQGRYQQAAYYQRQSLKSRRDTQDPAGEANTLNNLALIEIRQGQHARAAAHLRRSLALYQQTGDLNGEAYALSNLGHVNTLQASYQQAVEQLEQALSLFRQIRDPVGEGNALTHLGELDLLSGRNQQADTHLRQAITISREIGDPSSEAEALNALGEVLLAADQASDARGQHASALTLTTQIGDKYQQARAHDGLGRAYHATGDPGKAREHWQEAVTLYERLSLPEADQVRAQLTATAAEILPGP